MAWELDPKAKKGGVKSGHVDDPLLIAGIFERTVAAYARAAQLAADEETRILLKTGESSTWVRYANWGKAGQTAELALAVARRAVRACPESPSAWSSLLLTMVRSSPEMLWLT